MAQKVRVRFAPSPTGPLHIGGVRTALFNYLFAKKHGGDFILRIEDTDQGRYVPGAEQYIVEAMNWLGVDFDESPTKPASVGPYRQSERKEIYKQYADTLIESGHAYYAFDTPQALDKERKACEENSKTFIYNWHNRETLDNSLSLCLEETKEKLEAGTPFVIRFKTPQDEILHLEDVVRGTVKIDTNVLDDKVLFKSDGMPTYHLANIVDDHLMKISHVIRGEEWLPSLALHVLLYKGLGWEAPIFAHLPLIMKPTGKGKLSKRDGDKMGFPVFPLQWKTPDGELFSGYREDGYLPKGVLNMLAFLGWNPGTEQELFTLEQLIADFSLERVNKAGAKFDPDKTTWFQQQYLRSQTDEELAKELKEKIPALTETNEALIQICGLMKERATFIQDVYTDGHYLFERPTEFDSESIKKRWKSETSNLIHAWKETLNQLSDFDAITIENAFKTFLEQKEVGVGAVLLPFRLSVTGVGAGPGMFDIAAFLGKAEIVERMETALLTIQKMVNEA